MNPITTREIAQSSLSPTEVDHALAIARHIFANADPDDVRTITHYGLMLSVGAPVTTERIAAEMRSCRLINRDGGDRLKGVVRRFRYDPLKRDAFENLIAEAIHRLRTGAL